MTTSHRILRLLTFITTMSMLLLGPVAFGASISAADEQAPDVAAAAFETTDPPPDAAVDEAGDQPGELAAQGAGSGEGDLGTGGSGDGDLGTGGSGDGDLGTDEEAGHGEGTALLVCLATGDREAPYTAALFMPTAIINGHGVPKENGPAVNPVEGVFPAEEWGNIIPAFTHPNGKGTYPGLNLDGGGQANLDAGCGADTAGPPIDSGHETVVVCIATEDSITPYEMEKWMVQKIINGHGMPQKNGPAVDPVEGVFPAEVWGNIIPVFTHTNGKATYPGLNLEDGGQAILDAGCVYVVPVTSAPAPGPAPAPKDFCPNLDGVQWENYDCNTPQATAAVVTVPADVVTAATAVVPQLVPTPVTAAMPAQVAVPTEQTPPAAVDAGYGPTSAPVSPLWAVLMILAGCFGATGAARAAGRGAA